jgi:hypothetical protein
MNCAAPPVHGREADAHDRADVGVRGRGDHALVEALLVSSASANSIRSIMSCSGGREVPDLKVSQAGHSRVRLPSTYS